MIAATNAGDAPKLQGSQHRVQLVVRVMSCLQSQLVHSALGLQRCDAGRHRPMQQGFDLSLRAARGNGRYAGKEQMLRFLC